ncbi:hypothetical protein D770_25720 [Flammeovirgaceae bacterium 311]|nr:hypothetical protein D770_25720 [Flammeovirgaceae bacterium 311]
MQTIRLRVNDKVYKHLMWFLNKFSKDELEIIEEDQQFLSAQKELHKDLEMLEKGQAELIDLQQLDDELEATIRRYED